MSAPGWAFDEHTMALGFYTVEGRIYPLAMMTTDAFCNTPAGEAFNQQQRRLGERIADALNQAHVFPELPKEKPTR